MFLFAKGKAGHALFQDEGGNALRALGLVSHGKDDVNISGSAVGNEDLAAVQHVVVADFFSPGLLSC